MKMICHQAIGMHLPAGFQTCLLECAQKLHFVLIIQENRLAPVPSAGSMKKCTFIFDPGGTRHQGTLAKDQLLCQWSAFLPLPRTPNLLWATGNITPVSKQLLHQSL